MEYIKAKQIVMRVKDSSNWFGMDYNMNIYKGCCHGCIYCDSRSDCYKIGDFDKVRAKENAIEIIRNELVGKIKKGVVATGAMSDPYNPFEEKLELTRHALELISATGHGALVMTKSNLILRDLDILKEINEHSPTLAAITITTANDAAAKAIEPNVCSSSKRFEAIAELSENGIFSGILLMPVLPFINDNEENIALIVDKAHESGAKFIYPMMGMTLRQGQREYFYEKLDESFPGVKEKYIKAYGNKYSCMSKNAKKLWTVFSQKCNEYGILYDMRQIISAYKTQRGATQLGLFDLY